MCYFEYAFIHQQKYGHGKTAVQGITCSDQWSSLTLGQHKYQRANEFIKQLFFHNNSHTFRNKIIFQMTPVHIFYKARQEYYKLSCEASKFNETNFVDVFMENCGYPISIHDYFLLSCVSSIYIISVYFIYYSVSTFCFRKYFVVLNQVNKGHQYK